MLAVAGDDAQRALGALQADWYANASDDERRASEQVVDHNAAEITCPACGESFASGPAECPECGLGLV